MREVTFEDYRARILAVLVFIQQHLDEALALEELAAVAHFSPFHFHRVFRGLVGESVKEHVRRLRLERAAHQLRHTGQPITELALGAGYESLEAFSRAFHKLFGQTPTDYRLLRRVAAYGPAISGIHYVTEGALDDFRPAQPRATPLTVRIETLPEMRIAFIRHVGPYEQTDAAYAKLMGWAGRRGLLKQGTDVFGIAYDDPQVTAAERLRYDAALVVPSEVGPEGEISIQTISGGKYAVATHQGPYETLGETYARLCGEWIPHSGREVSPAPALEFYRNTPTDTAPAELITDIYMRLVV